MKKNTRNERKKQIDFEDGMASMDGGKSSVFTEKLLMQYEMGQLSASELKRAIVEKYTRATL